MQAHLSTLNGVNIGPSRYGAVHLLLHQRHTASNGMSFPPCAREMNVP